MADSQSPLQRLLRHPEWLVVALAGLVVLLTFRTYGISWDETVQDTYGRHVLDYFLSLGRDTSADDYLNLRFYGPLFELIAAAVTRLAGRWHFEIRHLLNAVTGLLALIAAIRYARLFDRPWLPLLTAVTLVCLPRFYGHWFANSKDIPFACAFAWAMWSIGRLLVLPHAPRWRDALLAGLLTGLALAIRVGAFLVFCFLAAAAVTYLLTWVYLRRRAPEPTPAAIPWASLALRGAALVAVAWAIMVIPWPWAHQNPILNPIRAFLSANQFAHPYPVLFEGKTVLSDALPWYYVPKYIVIATPLLVFPFAIAGTIHLVAAPARRPTPSTLSLHLLTLLWLLFPVAYVVVTHPNVYDGIRHFLFIMPALAIATALGAHVLYDAVPASKRRLVLAAVLAVLALPLVSMVRLHPYQTTYFSPVVGGVTKACLSYETDYWATSYKEAIEWINRQPRPPDGRPLVIVVAANNNNQLCASYYLAPDIRMAKIWTAGDPYPRPFDYYVGMTRYNMAHTFADLPIVHVVGRQGAAFTIIRAPR